MQHKEWTSRDWVYLVTWWIIHSWNGSRRGLLRFCALPSMAGAVRSSTSGRARRMRLSSRSKPTCQLQE